MSRQKNLTQEEWEAWEDHPGTQALKQYLLALQGDLKRRWAEGEFTSLEQYATAIKNAKAIGMSELLDNLQHLNYEELCGVIYEE